MTPWCCLVHLVSSSRRSRSRRLSRSSAFVASSLCFSASQVSSLPVSCSTSVSRAFFSLGAGDLRVGGRGAQGGESQGPHWAHVSWVGAGKVGRWGARCGGPWAGAQGGTWGRRTRTTQPPLAPGQPAGWPPALSPPGGPVGAPKACRPRPVRPALCHPGSASPRRTCWEEGTPARPVPSPVLRRFVLLTCPHRGPGPSQSSSLCEAAFSARPPGVLITSDPSSPDPDPRLPLWP